MKTSCLAGCLAVSLVGMEICESKEIHFVDDRTVSSIQPRSTNTLAWNPHTHFELDTEVRATTAVLIFASGHQVEEVFRLFIHPAASGFKLIGYPVSAEPDGTTPQLMYGFCPSIESLTELLLSKAGLPTAQIENVRRSAIAGSVQEIGGSHSPVMRLFRRIEMERIGLTFRPLE